MSALTSLEISISKNNSILAPEDTCMVDVLSNFALTFNCNLSSLGYTLSKEALLAISSINETQAFDFCKQIIAILKKSVGAHRNYNPMYPNFPKQVMEASDFELYINAMTHYWGIAFQDKFRIPMRILPKYRKESRPELDDHVELKVIGLGDEKSFRSIFTKLMAANAAVSEFDRNVIKWFVDNRKKEIPSMIPANIPQKENLTYLLGLIFQKEETPPLYLLPCFKTATDVLRTAVVLSKGDVSLAAPTKFRRFKRAERRYLLAALDQLGDSAEDMLRRPEVFKRLSRELRPGDYSEVYPNAFKSFNIIRNKEPYQTYNSKLEFGVSCSSFNEVMPLLQQRPGEFVRRLDKLLRNFSSSDCEKILSKIEEENLFDNVSTPVLIQAYSHFKHRNSGLDKRAFLPKGNVAKMMVVENKLGKLNYADRVVSILRGALIRKFSKLPKLGNVYIDPLMYEQKVPFAVRSASRTLRTIARGSRIPFKEGNTIRIFIWWKEDQERIDVDLSVVLFNSEFKHMGDVSYRNLRIGKTIHHSGDITSAPKGACEFIDVNIDGTISNGVRYVGMAVNSYTGQNFIDMKECFAGWMIRQKQNSGEIFEPKTVQEKIDLTSQANASVPAIFDLKERTVIWSDISLKNIHKINDVKTTNSSISDIVQAIVTLPKPNLGELFEMHAVARGTIVDKKESADKVFSLTEGTTPYDQDVILSEYLA